MAPPCWIILGASSAIARAFGREIARRGGGDVVLAGRDVEDLERSARDLELRYRTGAVALHFDAQDFASHRAFAAECRRRFSGTLNLFLAFGSMPEQADMERDFALCRSMIDSTFTGAASVLSAFVPLLEAQRAGRVIVLGSVAGDRGRRKNYAYGAAKAGLHAFVQGLRARLAPAGVGVLTVKPGFIDTGMTFGRPGMFLVASPAACARACLAAAERGQETIYFPRFWRGIMTLLKLLPERLFKRLNI